METVTSSSYPVIAALAWHSLLLGLIEGNFIARSPQLIESYGLDYETWGLVLSALTPGVILGTYFANVLATRYGSRSVVVLGVLVLCCLLPLVGLHEAPGGYNAGLLVTGILGWGLGIGVLDVAVNEQVLLSTIHTRSSFMGLVQAFYPVGGVVGSLVGAAMASVHLDALWSFLIFGAFGIAVSLSVVSLLFSKEQEEDILLHERIPHDPAPPRFGMKLRRSLLVQMNAYRSGDFTPVADFQQRSSAGEGPAPPRPLLARGSSRTCIQVRASVSEQQPERALSTESDWEVPAALRRAVSVDVLERTLGPERAASSDLDWAMPIDVPRSESGLLEDPLPTIKEIDDDADEDALPCAEMSPSSRFSKLSLDMDMDIEGRAVIDDSLPPTANTTASSSRLNRSQESVLAMLATPGSPVFFMVLICFFTELGVGSISDWSSIYLANYYGASELTSALAFTVFSLCFGAVQFASDYISMELSPESIFAVSGLVGSFGIGLTVLSYYVIEDKSEGLVVAILGFGISGLGLGCPVPVIYSMAADIPNIDPIDLINLFDIVAYTGVAIGPAIIGGIAGGAGDLTWGLLFDAFLLLAIALIGGIWMGGCSRKKLKRADSVLFPVHSSHSFSVERSSKKLPSPPGRKQLLTPLRRPSLLMRK